MNCEPLFLRYLPEIDRAITFVCRRRGLREQDAEDFASLVHLKLLENDCAVLKSFEGRASFRTFISIVVNRAWLDYQNHERGKWRPSAEARRMGRTAVLLETLTQRDGETFEAAARTLESSAGVSRSELESLAARLPARARRQRSVEWEAVPDEPSVEAVQLDRVRLAERECVARKASAIVRTVIDNFPEEDRIVVRLHYQVGMTVAQIARSLGVEQRPLYSRLHRRLGELRRALETAGISAAEAFELVESGALELDFGWQSSDDARPDAPSSPEEGQT